MAPRVTWLRHRCPMEENDIQSPSKTHGGPPAIKREAEAVQDQPPALLYIFLRPVPTAGARLFAQHWCVGQRGLPAVSSVWLPVTRAEELAPSRCLGRLRGPFLRKQLRSRGGPSSPSVWNSSYHCQPWKCSFS